MLLGISQGGAAAISYAVANPDRVSHLVLYGAYAQGRAKQGDRAAEEAQRARIALTRSGWGQNNPVYRQLFTSRFIPGATEEQIRWFNELCRTRPPAIWRRASWSSACTWTSTELLPRVSVPTLVLHARADEAVSPAQGRLMAARIPDATLVELDSRNHILLEHEPAWGRFKEEVLAFTGPNAAADGGALFAALSPREREILLRIADGPHQHRNRPRSSSSARRRCAITSRESSRSSACTRVRRRSCSRRITACCRRRPARAVANW